VMAWLVSEVMAWNIKWAFMRLKKSSPEEVWG
jgi:hypothetical protein